MVYLYDNILKGIISHARINGRVYHGNKIPKRFRRKKPPQIHRHGNGYRKLPKYAVRLLLFQKGIEQHRIQIFRYRYLIFS